jgi:beta-barrel assembly-enhancing protease
MPRFDAALLAPVFTAALVACARPTAQVGTVAPEAVAAEQLRQRQLFIESDLRQQQRVDDAGHALLAAATPFCGSALTPRVGARFANVHSFPREEQEIARSLGFSDTLVIVGVAQGSTAARYGFSLGDRVVAIDGGPPPRGPDAVSQLASTFAGRPTYAPRLTLEQGPARFIADVPSGDHRAAEPVARVGGQLRVAMPADTVCAFELVATRGDELNAWADGANITVTSGMLRFLPDGDELAAVLAHEIAHNVLRHVQGQQKNVSTGGQPDAIGGSGAATPGVNTNGELAKTGANVGSTVYSRDVEGEADYLGMYLLARARRPIGRVATFWRRMAQENPVGTTYASAHPTTPERFVRLENMSREIEQKIAMREDLRPEMRDGSLDLPSTVAEAPANAAAAKRDAADMAAVLVDRPHGATALVKVPKELPPTRKSSPGEVAVISTTTILRGDTVSYTFGPPVPRNGLSITQVRRHAREAFDDGREALELRLYDRAEDKFREAVLYDGSEARYHAALGGILLKRGKRVQAEAVLSAAVLLDVESADYRQLLIEARKRQ